MSTIHNFFYKKPTEWRLVFMSGVPSYCGKKNISSQYISIGKEYQMLCQCRKIKSVNKADFTQLNIQISNDSEFFLNCRDYIFFALLYYHF